MPCETYTPREDNQRLVQELNLVTRLLCALCTELENVKGMAWPEDVIEWWLEHKRCDEAKSFREERARALQKNIDSLTAKLASIRAGNDE